MSRNRKIPRVRLKPHEYAAVMRAREQGVELTGLSPSTGTNNIADEMKDGGNKREISLVSEIRTAEDALRYAEIDTSVWEIERSVVNKWDMGYKDEDGSAQARGLWQVKLWLRRRARRGMTDALEEIHRRAEAHSPRYDEFEFDAPEGEHTFVLSLYDQHFGKLAWEQETKNNYDLRIAEEYFENAAADLMRYTDNFDVSRIVIPFGNDFLHVDNILLTTQSGTTLGADTEGRYAKIVSTAFAAMVRCIERCMLVAPVEVVLVMGNHDPTVMYHLARELRAWFRHTDRVAVDTEFCERKYRRYGATLIGFNHGDKIPDSRLVNAMPLEAKELWGAARFYEIHTGHLHVKKEKRPYAIDTIDGILLRRIPSLSGTDAWHFRKGYVGYRAAEAYLYHEEHGPVGNFIAMGRGAK